jgi:hypothetical protein
MMARYAENTTVSASRSREEVYRLLERYGADQRIVGDDATRATVGFRLKGRHVKIDRALPPRRSFSSQAGYDREIRRQWRVLILLLKARLEIVAEGAETVEEAFASYLMLPDGSVVGDHLAEVIDTAYRTGQMPESILPGLPPAPKVIELPQRSGT